TEHGPLNVMKAMAGRLVKEDPMEVLLRGGGVPVGEGQIRAVTAVERAKLTQNFHDMQDLKGIGGFMRRVDDFLFFGMQATERVNRGIALNVGLTQAKNAGLGFWDALRVAHQVS